MEEWWCAVWQWRLVTCSSAWNCRPYGSASIASSSSLYRLWMEVISLRSSAGRSSSRISPRELTLPESISLSLR